MSLKKIIIRNVAAGWVEKATSIIATVIITPILFSHFGKYEYGMWVAIGQGASLLMLLDFGIANSVSRFIARNLALENREENVRVFNTALAIFFSASVLVLITTAIILPLIPDIFDVVESHRRVAFWLFGLIGVNIAIVFPLRVGRGLLQGRDRYDLISLYHVASSLLRLLLVILIFGRGVGDLLLLALVVLGLNLSTEIALFLTAMKQHPNLRFKHRMITIKNFKEMTSLGGSALVQTISANLYRRGQVIAVSIILGISSTPLFSIPSSIIIILGPVISRLGATFTPIASRMDATKENGQLQKLNILGVRYGLALSLPISIFLFFYGQELLTLWLGRCSELAEADISLMSLVLSIMVIPFALGCPQMATRSILRGTGKHWLAANGLFFSSLVGLITGILVMLFSNLGVLGAAIGWIIRFVLADILLFPFSICRHLRISGWYYFKKAYMPPLASAFLLMIFCISLTVFLPSDDIFKLIIVTLFIGVVSCLLILYIVLLPEHRTYLFSMINQGIAIFRHAGSKNHLVIK